MCKYCNSALYQEISTISKYSGIEVCMDKFGNLRVRTETTDESFEDQNIVKINYCPMCGRKLDT